MTVIRSPISPVIFSPLREPTALYKGGGAKTQFSGVKKLIEDGASDVTFLVIGDSTSNANDEWGRLFANYLAAAYPTHTVNYSVWDDGAGSYPSPTVVQTGSGPRTIHFWNASVAGAPVYYMLGDKYALGVGAIDPDVIIWNHGHNVAGVEALKRGQFYAAFETIKQLKPNANTVIVKQNPNRDSGANDLSPALAEEIAAVYGDTVIDFFAPFVAAGKPSGYYADAVHPSSTAQETIMLPVITALWEDSRPAEVAPNGSIIDAGGVNLLNLDASDIDQGYGYFSGYASGTPSGWSLNGTPTLSKEETIVDSAKGDTFSVQIDVTTALHGINRTLAAGALAAVKADGFMTLAVRKYVPAGGGTNVGRIGIVQSGTGAATLSGGSTPSYNRGHWMWDIIAGHPAADTITGVIPRLYGDTDSNASTAYFGRAILVAGKIPGGDSAAPTA